MQRKFVVPILTVSLCGLGLLSAPDAKRKTLDAKTKIQKFVSKQDVERFQITSLETDETAITAISSKSKSHQTTDSRQDVVFFDDFEGGQGRWQSGATWGIRTTPEGPVDEDRSDWELAINNFHSTATSWHETNVTSLNTDMLMSPGMFIPAQIEGGQPLDRLSLDFWLDWDAVLPTSRLYVFFGLDTSLWAFDANDPGAGTSSWAAHNPRVPPFDVFSRQFLTTPEIDLTSAQTPITLSFLYKSISKPEFDYNKADVFTSDDDFVSYRTVASFDGLHGSARGGTAIWTSHSVSLNAYAGKVIKIRFSANGDYLTAQTGAIFALDNILVRDAISIFFNDDGGESGESSMVAEGFAPGNAVASDVGIANPTPNWINVQVPGNLLLTGGDGTLAVGDRVRIGIMFAYDLTGETSTAPPPGRGLYIDDVNLVGEGIQDDIAAIDVSVPFPMRVGEAQTFALNVSNLGTNPQANVQWQGTIFNNDTGAQVASVAGRRAGPIAPGGTVAIPSVDAWTPMAPGVYRITAYIHMGNDEGRTNDTTRVATDDPDGVGDARYSPFVVHDGNVLFSSALWDAPESPTPAQLQARGFQVNTSRSDPGVVTWQTTASALVPFVNLDVDYSGAYVQFDSLGRPQDEDLIVPNLDFSGVASDAWLTFKALGVGGFGFTRFSVGVSNNGGTSWNDVPGSERLRGIDPETGQNYGDPAFLTAGMSPAVLDITRWAAGYSNVWIRFRYQGVNDADWTIWSVAVSGKGLRAATLSSVTDIGGDQGKQVRLSWTRSPNDGAVAGVPITHYGVWRKFGSDAGESPTGRFISVENRRAMIDTDVLALVPGTRFYDANSAQAWDFIAAVLAHSDPDYNYVAPTLQDGVSACFMISAHTADSLVFANSNEACGTSTDDLAPNAPTLSGGQQSGFVQLSWTEPDNEEPASYSVYRRLAGAPSFGDPIATVTGLQYQDGNIQANTSYVYAIKAKDYADNVSAFSNELSVLITGVADRPILEVPTEYALGNNYPNPFNPQTTIAFALPVRGHVKLVILNSIGQIIEVLVDREMLAGYHQVMWSANGYTSGLYYYRLTANDFSQFKKMVLAK